MAPKDVHILILKTGEYVTLHEKRGFADVINLRILRWKGYPGYLVGSNVIQSFLYKIKARV